MRPVSRPFLPFLLSLLLMLTGQGVAASRGIGDAVGQMVLCTGSGPVVVYMDADGQPTKPPHFCPDYALSLLGAVIVPPVALPPGPFLAFTAPPRDRESLIAAALPRRPARAPPVV